MKCSAFANFFSRAGEQGPLHESHEVAAGEGIISWMSQQQSSAMSCSYLARLQ